MPYTPPPYRLTSDILKSTGQISEIIGELKSLKIQKPSPILRKQNAIRTIQGSLGIEGNSFNLDQVSAILEGKRVLGKPKEILEVKNAIACYTKMSQFNPTASRSLLDAHRTLMNGLTPRAGQFRKGAVGIFRGSKVSHIAPPVHQVPRLIEELFQYLKKSPDLELIKSCVFHYEFEFIHPFEDGNGRMGRFWQTLILSRYNPIFEYIPMESQIYAHQKEYYRVLEACDKKGASTEFIEWMLKIILKSLREFASVCLPETETFESRIESARKEFWKKSFSRQDYMRFIKTLSAPTASRDLATAVAKKILTKTGDKRTTRYSFR